MATFIVTSNRDDGRGGTLRAAIEAANASPGADVIEFDGNVFTGGRANLIRLEKTLTIRDSVTIDATRVAGVTVTADRAGNDVVNENFITDIDRSGRGDLDDNFRVLYVTDDNEATVLNGLTLTGGYVEVRHWGGVDYRAPRFAGEYESRSPGGGGVFVDRGELTIANGAVSGNAVDNRGETSFGSPGGGIVHNPFFDPFDRPVTPIWLRLIGSSVEGNRILGEDGTSGGGVHARWLETQNATIADNRTEGEGRGGGGVYVYWQGDFYNTTIHGNVSANGGSGGGVLALNNAQFFNSTIVGNVAKGEGSQGGGVSGRDFGDAVYEGQLRNEVKRFVNTIVIGNEAEGGFGTDDVLLDQNEFRDFKETNLFEGVNIINDYNDGPRMTLNGPILSRAASSIFESATPTLADNGGGVKTVKLRASPLNPAIDASEDFATDADAIGRPAQDHPGQGFDNDLPGIRDLGAYELPLLRGGLPKIVPGSDRSDRLKAGDGAELFELGGGRDRITGAARELDGDVASGFGYDDALVVRKARFGARDVDVKQGSLILEIDANGRGGPEATFTLEGTFRKTAVLVDRAGRNTEITLAKIFEGGAKRDKRNGDDGGRDLMDGGKGADVLKGRGGDDLLYGGRGKDKLLGGKGDDLLEGGAQNDLLSGGAGRDAFAFDRGFGKDRITDFDHRRDTLDFSGHKGVDGFRDLKVRKAGADVKVLDGDGGLIVIEDAKVRQIDGDVFDF